MATYKQFYVGVQFIPELSLPLAQVRANILALPNVTTAEEVLEHMNARLWRFVVDDTTVNGYITGREILKKIAEASYQILFLTGSLMTNAAGP